MPGLVPGIHVLRAEWKGVDGRVKPGHDVVEALGAKPAMKGRPIYFALSILVTVYPEAASSASKVTLSPTFTCLSIAGSLTR
jgi:hypothetical protein